MSGLKKSQKKLQKLYGNKVCLKQDGVKLVLTGSLDYWQDAVNAGRIAADKKHGFYVVNDIECTKEKKTPIKLPTVKDSAIDGAEPDVLVIGAGVVGAAIARELSRLDISIMQIDKEHDVALHASSRNDGMVHPGIDLKKGQVKREYNMRGNAMYDKTCLELCVPFKRTGQNICFNKKWLSPIMRVAPLYWKHALGLPCKYVSRSEILAKEPMLAEDISCALSFPTAGIVCPYGLTIAFEENAVQNGVKLVLDTAVLSMQTENGKIKSVLTNRGTVYPKVVINAAGVFSDDVAQMAGDRFFSIHPRRGTNSIMDKKSAYKVRTIASGIGTTATKTTHSKGGGLVSTVDGNLLVGPDAVETIEKEDFATYASSVHGTFAKQSVTLPSLKESEIITYFTGIRAATYEEDFVICKGKETQNIVHAAGIQSPGLTAAPAIAVDVARMAEEILSKEQAVNQNKSFNPIRIPIPHIAAMPLEERDEMIKKNPDYGVIVCRCEEVSKGEIIDAMHRCVPCDTVDGIKRRVRPGMGRCQGGFCGPQITEIIAEEMSVAPENVLKSGSGSNILYGNNKELHKNPITKGASI
ncbi:MAG: NAD(P)/FAD-dependent oxidoreductase [Oscillospiraceae bacterium]